MNSVSGAFGLNVLGINMLTLANSTSYTGPTTVSSGTLNLGHNLAVQDSTVSVSSVVP